MTNDHEKRIARLEAKMESIEKQMATKADIEVSTSSLKAWLFTATLSAAGLIIAAIKLF